MLIKKYLLSGMIADWYINATYCIYWTLSMELTIISYIPHCLQPVVQVYGPSHVCDDHQVQNQFDRKEGIPFAHAASESRLVLDIVHIHDSNHCNEIIVVRQHNLPLVLESRFLPHLIKLTIVYQTEFILFFLFPKEAMYWWF